MASQVQKGTLLSAAWQNVYDLIKDVANIPDPVSGASDYRKWVYSREPDVKAKGFGGFPFIIVHPALLSFDEEQSLDRKRRVVNWTIEVEVISSDRGVGDNDGQGNAINNQLCDAIVELFNDAAIRKNLEKNGMLFSMPQVTSQSVEPFNETLVYRRSIFLSFKTRMAVSA